MQLMFCIAQAGLSLSKDLQIHFIGGKVIFVVVSATSQFQRARDVAMCGAHTLTTFVSYVRVFGDSKVHLFLKL